MGYGAPVKSLRKRTVVVAIYPRSCLHPSGMPLPQTTGGVGVARRASVSRRATNDSSAKLGNFFVRPERRHALLSKKQYAGNTHALHKRSHHIQENDKKKKKANTHTHTVRGQHKVVRRSKDHGGTAPPPAAIPATHHALFQLTPFRTRSK